MSLTKYSTIEQTVTSEIIEKKSRFICEIRHVENEDEINDFFAEVKKQYWDARHNCTAFIVGKEQPKAGSSDDGEPSGTAGKPMLEVLSGANITNVAAVVTRYFGGTLLGTGGLVRAYSQAVKEALNKAEIITYSLGEKWKIKADYSSFGKIQTFVMKENIKIDEIVYETDVTAFLYVSNDMIKRINEKLIDITSGNINIEIIEKMWV